MTKNYHDRPEWSYSDMKLILDHGIDYAVAAKRKMLPQPKSAAIDLGQLAHMLVLGGADCYALKEDSGFKDYRTNAAKEWKAEQERQGKAIIDQKQWEAVCEMVKHIDNHSHTMEYLKGEGSRHEIEMYAKADGVDLRGKADALQVKESMDWYHGTYNKSLLITDIKTTAQFDECVPREGYHPRKPYYMHYDLQAAVYTLIGSASQNVSASFTNYYFCFVETVAPYRVQFVHASMEFLESGERKLRKCIDAIKEFGDREPNFMIEEIPELGDYSL